MKNNATTVITVGDIALVPYRREHVPIYHGWMQDPFLQETTCSEPLTLEQEYQMQQSWHDDPKKCTFIVLSRAMQENRVGTAGERWGGMIGDVNMYWNDAEDPRLAELEVMVAEPTMRGAGRGALAAAAMLDYALDDLAVERVVVRINEANAVSRRLFARHFGFVEVSRSAVFEQVTMAQSSLGLGHDPAIAAAFAPLPESAAAAPILTKAVKAALLALGGAVTRHVYECVY